MAESEARAPAADAQASSAAPDPHAFETDTAVHRESASTSQELAPGDTARFSAEITRGWRAGRGPHGGYLAAIILRALTEAVAEPGRSPRSLTIHYPRAPRPGPASISVTLERRGRSLSTLSARMEQEGVVTALALATFSAPWPAPALEEARMPQVAGPDAVRETTPLLARRIEEGLAPQFMRQLVMQPRIGAPPFSGSDGAMEVGAWLGLNDPARPVDAIALALFSDALYSPPFVRMTEPATSPTIDLTIHFRAHAEGEHVAGELCFAHFRSRAVHEGFFEEDGTVYGADGSLLAQSRQLAILLRL